MTNGLGSITFRPDPNGVKRAAQFMAELVREGIAFEAEDTVDGIRVVLQGY